MLHILVREAFDDIKEGFGQIGLAHLINTHRRRSNYHRSSLGMFYISLTTLAWALGLGLLSSILGGRDPGALVPYVGLGISVWIMLSGLVAGGADVFISGFRLTSQMRLPYSLIIFTHLIQSLQQISFRLPVVLILILFHPNGSYTGLPFALLGVIIILMCGFGLSLFLGIFAARFRDVKNVIEVGLQLGLFLSGIFWDPSALGEWEWLMVFNPFYQAIEAVRGPLLGHADWVFNLIYISILAIVLNVLGVVVFVFCRRKIPYWVSM